jgi:hypothetical protein
MKRVTWAEPTMTTTLETATVPTLGNESPTAALASPLVVVNAPHNALQNVIFIFLTDATPSVEDCKAIQASTDHKAGANEAHSIFKAAGNFGFTTHLAFQTEEFWCSAVIERICEVH